MLNDARNYAIYIYANFDTLPFNNLIQKLSIQIFFLKNFHTQGISSKFTIDHTIGCGCLKI